MAECTSKEAREKSEVDKSNIFSRNVMSAVSAVENGQTTLHEAIRKGHIEMVKILLDGGASVNKPDAKGWTPKVLAAHQGNRSIYDLLLSYENRKILDEHRIDLVEEHPTSHTKNNQGQEREKCGANFLNILYRTPPPNSNSSISSCLRHGEAINLRKRVAIHVHCQNERESQGQRGKLIVLPDSMEELLRVAGKFCLTRKSITTCSRTLGTIIGFSESING